MLSLIKKVSTLKACVLAGSATTEVQLIKMQESFPNTKFFNVYGLSEMAFVSMASYDVSINILASLCEKPIDKIQVKIVDLITKKECKPGEEVKY